MSESLSEEAKTKPIEIWFQDEARVGQKGTLTRIWAERGSRPRAPRDQRYAWAYLFGAVCPARATGAAVVLPFADAWAMSEHLKEISRCVAPGAHAVVVTDGAGYHEKGCRDIPDNISILTLPSYSPELNPTENVWQYLRQNHLANTVFDTYQDIVGSCCSAWNDLMRLPEAIVSITQREWAKPVIS